MATRSSPWPSCATSRPTPGERAAYLKQALAVRRAQGAEVAEGAPEPDAEAEAAEGSVELTPQRYAELGAHEQFVLTVSERGFGKRSSSYDYRISGRGGKGIIAMIVNERNGRLVASFPVEESDQIMLVTDGGKLIRCPVDDVRIAAPQHPGRAHLQDRGEREGRLRRARARGRQRQRRGAAGRGGGWGDAGAAMRPGRWP